MKHTAILLTTLGILLGSLQAQVQVNVPSFLNYQGKVTDSAGEGLGTGTPVNRKVIFRIFDAATGGNLIWTEEQTASFSGGEFNVLLGNGIQATGTASSEAHPEPFATVFNGVLSPSTTDRYLELTVDNGDNTINGSDLAITPRQRLTTNAFSFRARTADGVPLHKDLQFAPSLTPPPDPEIATSDNGLGWYGTNRPFQGIPVNGPVLYGQGGGALGSANGTNKNIALQWNASGVIANNVSVTGTITGNVTGNVTGSGAGLTALNADNLSSGTVPVARIPSLDAAKITTGTLADARLSSNVVLQNSAPTFTNPTIGSLELRSVGSTPYIDFSRTAGDDWNARIILNSDHLGIQGNTTFYNNVGIGTTAPQATLHVQSATPAILVGSGSELGSVFLGNANHGISRSFNGQPNDVSVYTTSGSLFLSSNGKTTTNHFILTNAGRVGIGTNNPAAPLHVVGSANSVFNFQAYLGMDGADDVNSPSYTGSASIIASDLIRAAGYHVASDARIKNRLQRSDSNIDLSTLLGIEITEYSMRDTNWFGKGLTKKVIAQQVEMVFPQAVIKTTDVVPDIFKKAVCKDCWVHLTTDLKVGERVRLVGDKAQEVYEVLEIDEKDHKKFRTAFKPEGDKVFVYGREVNDFRTVDYDAISMLNVSATQQIKKEKDAEVKALRDENTALRTELEGQRKALDAQAARVTALEAKDQARDAKLAAIEKLLLSADKPAARTVSLKQGNGAE